LVRWRKCTDFEQTICPAAAVSPDGPATLDRFREQKVLALYTAWGSPIEPCALLEISDMA
jgi:hypothetical protein